MNLEGMALFSMKNMCKEDREVCTRFIMKQITKNGYVSEDDCRAVLEFDMKKTDERIKARQELEKAGMVIYNE